MKLKVSVNDIEKDLCELDSVYRESLAKALVDMDYVSDTPLNLSLGTDQQQREVNRVYSRALKPKELKEIIHYINKDMADDFQYGSFVGIYSKYLNIANQMEKQLKSKCREER